MNPGILAAIGAYGAWGLLPIYWKLLDHVATPELLCHRIVWSCVLLILFVRLSGRWRGMVRDMSRRILGIYAVASVLVGINWFLYVWSVNTGHIVETSLGYFINPLLSVALGVIFMGERLRPGQWVPITLATVAVIFLTVQHGQLPWRALSLAVTFSLYGLVKKKAPLGAFEGLTLETTLLVLPTAMYLVWVQFAGTAAFLHAGLSTDLLLIGAGAATTTPLVMFSAAARRIPLSMIGILQYIAPSIQFLLGVFLYDEPFSRTQLMGFSMVWAAVALFLLEQWARHRPGLHRLRRPE